MANENSKTRKNIIQHLITTLSLYCLSTILPLFLNATWLLIPLQPFWSRCIAYLLYYLWTFVIWIIFMDNVLPGCPLWFVVVTTLVYIGLSIGVCLIIYFTQMETVKLMYSILGGVETLGGWILYICFVIYLVVKKNSENSKKLLYNEEEFKCWSEKLMSVFSCCNNLKQKPQPTVLEETLLEEVTEEDNRQTVDKGKTYATVWNIIKILIGVILFKIIVFCVWFYLNWFAVTFEIVKSLSSKLALNVLFQGSKLVARKALEWGSTLLLPTKEVPAIRYFAPLASNMFFMLFYRHMFLNVQGWGELFAMTAVTLVLTVPIDVLPFMHWYFRLKKYLYSLFMKLIKRKITNTENQDAEFQNHLKLASGKYFVTGLSYSMTMATFFSSVILLRYTYNSGFYHSLKKFDPQSNTGMPDDRFLQLVYEYLVLWVIELGVEIAVRVFIYLLYKKDIHSVGREEVLGNERSCFIVVVFIVHFMNDIYYFMQDFSVK